MQSPNLSEYVLVQLYRVYLFDAVDTRILNPGAGFAAGACSPLPLQLITPGILCGVSQGESKQLFREGYSFGWFCIQKNSARTTENTLRYEVRNLRKILESTRQHLKCAITRSMTTRW